MSKYLRIKNVGVAPLQSFTIMGLSTARGDAKKIGQFGSGNKHGVMTCIRHNISPRIFLDKQELEFFTEEKEMNGTKYQQLGYMFDGKREMLSYCLAHGAMDWDNIPMALREFVSNALDATGNDIDKVSISVVESVDGESGSTIVYIPLTPDVEKFYFNIEQYFMHFRRNAQAELSRQIIEKFNPSPALIYRKGTFVRTVSGRINSVYDYNFGDELKIDESRTLDDYSVKYYACRLIVQDPNKVVELIQRMDKEEIIWESSFEEYWLSSASYEDIKNIQDLIKIMFGKDIIFTNSKSYKENCVESKINCMLVSDGWHTFLVKNCGFPQFAKDGHTLQTSGYSVCDACETTKETCSMIWDLFKRCDLTFNKSKPKVYNFDAIQSESGKITNGYYDSNTNSIYIRKGYEEDIEVMMEELGHYVTGYDDFTRGFQSFAFRLAANTFISYKRKKQAVTA